MDEKRKKDRIFVVCQIAVAVLGAAAIIIKGNAILLAAYIPLMLISIPWIYFNYSLCKWENKWHAAWNEKNPCDGEPSQFRLITGKIGEWALFIIALVLAVLPAGIFG